MATIVVDELITKLDYQHDEATLKQASAAVKSLEQQNKAAAEAADKLSAENRKLAEHTDALTQAQIDLAEQITESKQETSKLVAEQHDLRAAIKEAGSATDQQTKRLAQLDREIKQSKQHTRELREESSRLGLQKRKVSQESRKLAREQADVAKQSRRAAHDQRKLSDAMRTATDRARSESTALSKLTEHIKGVAGGQLAADAVRAVGTGIFELGRNVIETGASFESLRARLKTVEGSSKGAADAFALIQDFTKSTPFQLEEVTTAFVRLKSLGLDASQKSLTSFGNIAAAQGKSIIDFIEAVADASTGEFERLKEFGIKASKQGEQVTFTFKGQQTVVKNTAKDIQGFLKQIGESDFAGAMADQMATTAGAISNVKDQLAQAADAIAQQGPLESFNALLSTMSEAIGGDNGLGKVIADILVIALDTVRKLFEGMPSDSLTQFLQATVTLVGQLADMLAGMATEQAGVMSMLLDFATTLIEVASAIFAVVKRLDEIKERLGGVPGPIDLILKGLGLLLDSFQFMADLLMQLLELLDPFLDALDKMAGAMKNAWDQGGTLGEVFSNIGAAARGFAEDLGLVNSQLEATANIGSIANKTVQDLYKTLDVAALTERRRKGDQLAAAELERRAGITDETLAQEQADRTRQREAADKRKRADAKRSEALAQFEGERIKDASDSSLEALIRDPSVPKKVKDRAEKEQTRRERDAKKKGAKSAQKTRESLLTADIDKQIDELAKQAGKRAAARAQLQAQQRGQPLTAADRNRIELQERKAVKERLSTRFSETGELPPGLATDLVQAAALPNIEQVGGRLAPPVITVNNQRIEITGNTFEATVVVEGGVSATPQQIATAAVTQAQQVTHQSLAVAVQNQLTSER